MRKPELGAYFYPLTTDCLGKQQRAVEVAASLGVPLDTLNQSELLITQQAQPLFEGHEQPITYCLDAETTLWDDRDESAMARQIKMASTHGLDFWIFDSFHGVNGEAVFREMHEPIETFKRLTGFHPDIKYAKLEVLTHARIQLPIPRQLIATNRHDEPNRFSELGSHVARLLIDSSIADWERPNYLTIMDRPYISIMTNQPNDYPLKYTIEEMKEYSTKVYGIEPYIAAVVRNTDVGLNLGRLLIGGGADALTGYAFLPDFEKGAPTLQDYGTVAKKREEEWAAFHNLDPGVSYIPPAVVGWDASARGEQGYSFAQVAGTYPYTPIVTNGSAATFKEMLQRSLDFIRNNVPPAEQIGLICSWNEVGEKAALLPQKRADGSVDMSYLKAVKSVSGR